MASILGVSAMTFMKVVLSYINIHAAEQELIDCAYRQRLWKNDEDDTFKLMSRSCRN